MEFISKIALNNHKTRAIKTGIGSAFAILIAEHFSLDFSSSAGIITLLTITTTKVEAIRLCINRIVTFILTMIITWFLHLLLGNHWLTYGIVLTAITFVFGIKNLLSTLSVNAVSITHLMVQKQITLANMMNEFYLLLIGLFLALLVNQFHDYSKQRHYLERTTQDVERRIIFIFDKVSEYLKNKKSSVYVWDDIIRLEKDLVELTKCAVEYQQNRLPIQDDYYVNYFEMRILQCGILHNLHYELKKIRESQQDVQMILVIINELKKHIRERSFSKEQIDQLSEMIVEVQENHVPDTKEEFINKARLYHILMNFEEFLKFKKRFYETLES